MIEQFIEQMLAEKGLPPGLDSEVKKQMIKNLSDRAINLINKRLVEAMTEEQATELTKVIDSNPDNPVAVQKFIEDSLPNKQEIVTLALAEFRSLYLGTK